MNSTPTILVTGAAGFIGSSLCEHLSAKHQVIGVDNFDGFYARDVKERNLAKLRGSSQFEFHELDILDTDAFPRIVTDHHPEVVVHLAARAGVRPSIKDPRGYVRTNVEGTEAVLDACRNAGVERLVYGSSSSVYGGTNSVPFSEDMVTDAPVSPYAATKKAGELLCATSASLYGLRIGVLRFFTVYGPRQRPDLAIAKFTRLIETGEPIPVFGDGRSARDYTYVDDIVDGIIRTIDWTSTVRNGTCDIFNIGENHTTTLSELIALIEKALGKTAVIERLSAQPGDMRNTWANIDKAVSVLGYSPRTPIEEGIRRYVAYVGGHR